MGLGAYGIIEHNLKTCKGENDAQEQESCVQNTCFRKRCPRTENRKEKNIMLKIGMNAHTAGFDIPQEEAFKIMKDCGFDIVHAGYKKEDEESEKRILNIAEMADRQGLFLESIHAPWGGINRIWNAEDEKGAAWVGRLKFAADLAKKAGCDFFTVHAANMPQFNNNGPCLNYYSEAGLNRFLEVIEYCAKLGVICSFETVEFAQLELKSLFDELRRRGIHEGVGITYDVGHWHCYPPNIDFADNFGDYVNGTHVHDNMGNKDPQVITWNDDWHLNPFDGTINWMKVGEDLKRSNYKGSIMMEGGRNGRMPWNAEYTTPEMFYSDMATRLRRIAMLSE